jgi:immune inhibitor A
MKLQHLLGLTLLASAFSLHANNLDSDKTFSRAAPADAGVINKERILYWLEKRGNVSPNATQEEKELAVAKYLSKKSFAGIKLPDELEKTIRSAERFGARTHKEISLNKELKQNTIARSLLKSVASDDVETRVKVLAVLVDFKDLKHDDNGISSSDTGMYYDDYNLEHYNDLLFSTTGFEGPSGQNLESAYQYYQQESGGKFFFEGQVQNWVTAENDAAYYGGNDPDKNDNDKDVAALVIEAITQLVANGVDLADYDKTDLFDLDGDGNVNEPDGIIDHVMLFHASIGEEAGGGDLAEDAIWSHRHFVFNDDNTIRGVEIPGSTIKAWGYTINPIDAAPGVVVHEFGHDLGLPDEYDTGNGAIGSPVSEWSVMASGSWVGSPAGSRPSAFSPYARDYLQERYQGNWIDQQVINFNELTTQTTSLVSTVNHTAVNQIKVNLPAEQLPFTAPYAGEYQFYSNQGHYLSNNLSFEIDLPAGTPSLEMIAHWKIEQDYDYVQVLVNETPITGNHTSAANTIYSNLGAYISGASSGIEGAEGDLHWVPLTFDLSAYAGGTVTIKIIYVTDQAASEYGFVADNITVKADGTDLVSYGGEIEGEVTLDGFSRNSNSYDAKPHNYYVQLRSHTGVDSELGDSKYDAGVLVWYRNENVSDNKVNDHAGEVFIGVVDADQNLIKSSNNNIRSTYTQLHDAAFSLYDQETYNSDDHLTANSLFSDLDDYSSPAQPESGIILPKLGLSMNVDLQSTDSTTATVTLTHGDSGYVVVEKNGLTVSLFADDITSIDNVVYTWDMGDETELTGASITHQYAAAGVYDVTVSYMTSAGLKSVVRELTLGAAIEGTMATEINAANVDFSADITGGEGALTYRWDFGDDTEIGTSSSVSHTYENTGTYQVTLEVRDDSAQVFVLQQNVVVSSVIALNADFTSSTSNLVASFTTTVSGGDEDYTYAWNFGDDGVSALANPSHTYGEAGTYTVTLTVTDGSGLTSEASNSVTVTAAAVVIPPAKAKSSGGGGGSFGFGLLFGLGLVMRFRK